MQSWTLPLERVEKGKTYLLESDPSDLPEAFAVRIPFPVPGAYKIGQQDYVIAFSNICTHMGCKLVKNGEAVPYLTYDPKGKLICGPCPCHGTSFDLTQKGLVILGPATQNLPQLKVEVVDGKIMAKTNGDVVDPTTEKWPF